MTRNQQIRHECLLQLYGSRSVALSIGHIVKVAHRQEFDFTDTEVLNELNFLIGQHLVEIVPNPGTGQTRYRITSAGVLHWENEEEN